MHGDEVPAGAAGDWLALVREGNGATVHPVSVSLVPEQDMMDEDGEETGRRVEVEPPLEPIVLVRGLAWFTGPVTTALMDERVDVGPALEARLNTVSSRLSVRCGEASESRGSANNDARWWSSRKPSDRHFSRTPPTSRGRSASGRRTTARSCCGLVIWISTAASTCCLTRRITRT